MGEGTRAKPEKVVSVTELHEKFARAVSAVLADFRGLTVQEITALRQQLREASLELAVVKNTLARLAVQETAFAELSPYLKGPTSITFSYHDAAAPAKVLSAYVKRQPKLAMRAGLFEGEIVPAEKIAEIAELPSREVLLAQALAAMQGPLAGFVWTLQGVLSTFIGTLQAIHDKKPKVEEEIMPDISREDVVTFIENMSVLELSQFIKDLQERFGVSAAMPMAMPQGGGTATAEAPQEEQTEFDVILSGAGDKKIQVIKVVRAITGLGLKEAKDLVDGAPKPVKEKISKDEAEELKKQLEEVGAAVEVK